jgi:hypothetical protein
MRMRFKDNWISLRYYFRVNPNELTYNNINFWRRNRIFPIIPIGGGVIFLSVVTFWSGQGKIKHIKDATCPLVIFIKFTVNKNHMFNRIASSSYQRCYVPTGGGVIKIIINKIIYLTVLPVTFFFFNRQLQDKNYKSTPEMLQMSASFVTLTYRTPLSIINSLNILIYFFTATNLKLCCYITRRKIKIQSWSILIGVCLL